MTIAEPVRRRTPKPKFWIADPAARQSFGRVLELPWVNAGDDLENLAMIQAARMQHRIVIHMRRYAAARTAAGEDGWTLPGVAQRLRTVDYDGLMRLMRGDVHMSLLHIADLTSEFGPILNLSVEVHRLTAD